MWRSCRTCSPSRSGLPASEARGICAPLSVRDLLGAGATAYELPPGRRSVPRLFFLGALIDAAGGKRGGPPKPAQQPPEQAEGQEYKPAGRLEPAVGAAPGPHRIVGAHPL